jgi:FkbM family methyltransferase
MSVLPPFARLLHRRIRRYCSGVPTPLLRHPQAELEMTLDLVLSHYRITHPDVRFLQVGAFDGVFGDALYPLIERHHLSGVLVEPQPRIFERLKANYARFAATGVFVFVNAAIAAHDGAMPLYKIKADVSGPDWLYGIASFDQRVVLRHAREFPELRPLVETEDVPCYTFETLFKTFAIERVDLLQIDAEGYDAELLRLFDVPARKPAIIRFEHKHLRRRDYDEPALFDGRGRYGDVSWFSVGLMLLCSLVGWGLVTNTSAGWLQWQGYLLGPLGLGGKEGDWAYAGLGVLVSLVLAFVAYAALRRGTVRRQEELAVEDVRAAQEVS